MALSSNDHRSWRPASSFANLLVHCRPECVCRLGVVVDSLIKSHDKQISVDSLSVAVLRQIQVVCARESHEPVIEGAPFTFGMQSE